MGFALVTAVVKYWQPIIAATATAIIALGLHTLAMNVAEISHDRELKQQAVALAQQCAEDKAITERVANDFQNKVADLNTRLADARRMYDRTCVLIADPASVDHGAAEGGKPAGSASATVAAIRANDLIELAGEGEKYRLQLLSCQAFIKSTWKAKKQP